MTRLALRFTRAARAHLRSIGEYTNETWGLEQRDRYLGQLFAGFEEIRRSPETGRSRDEVDKGLRSRRIQKHIAYYFVTRKTVIVVGILHERMDPSRHL
jgi:toxin ParE1/3/4